MHKLVNIQKKINLAPNAWSFIQNEHWASGKVIQSYAFLVDILAVVHFLLPSKTKSQNPETLEWFG